MQSGAKLAEEPTAQLRLGEAAAEIDAAWTLLRRDCEEVHERAEAGEVPSLEERHPLAAQRRLRGKAPGAGGRPADGIERGERQRGRFAAAAAIGATCTPLASHIALAWDAQGANYGRILLGLPSRDSKL